jgi:hypothetical protein
VVIEKAIFYCIDIFRKVSCIDYREKTVVLECKVSSNRPKYVRSPLRRRRSSPHSWFWAKVRVSFNRHYAAVVLLFQQLFYHGGFDIFIALREILDKLSRFK